MGLKIPPGRQPSPTDDEWIQDVVGIIFPKALLSINCLKSSQACYLSWALSLLPVAGAHEKRVGLEGSRSKDIRNRVGGLLHGENAQVRSGIL